MYLLVNPNGTKYRRLKYRIVGKEKTLSLGVFLAPSKGVSLAVARADALVAKQLINDGIDPSLHKKTEKLRNEESQFKKVTHEWWGKKKEAWSKDHAERVLATLEKDAFPIIGDKSIEKITASDCLMVIRSIEGRGALDIAARVKQRMAAVFRYGIYTGYCQHNPVDALKDVIESRKVQHRKSIAVKELPAYLGALARNDQITTVTRIAPELIVHTFVRPGELRAAAWEEFDLELREWCIPAERMKMNIEHVVLLTLQSLVLLQTIKLQTGNFYYVFPGYHDSKKT